MDDTWIRAWRRVRTNPTEVLHPRPGSNNTGELKALTELFDFFLFHSPYPGLVQLVVYTDSQYVLSVVQGDARPTTPHQLVSRGQKHYTAVRRKYRATVLKISSHVGIPGNELADSLAKRGIHARSSVGRLSYIPVQPSSPPESPLTRNSGPPRPPLNKIILSPNP